MNANLEWLGSVKTMPMPEASRKRRKLKTRGSAWDDNSNRAKKHWPAKIRGQINTALTKLLYLCQHRMNYLEIFFTGINVGLFKRRWSDGEPFDRIVVLVGMFGCKLYVLW
jgi:hypothetical protein